MFNVLVGKLCTLLHDRKGISAMEYAILAAVILTVVGTAMTTLGNEITAMVGVVVTKIQGIVGT
jgi:Flp pilus assembly pilin Flp